MDLEKLSVDELIALQYEAKKADDKILAKNVLTELGKRQKNF